MNRANDSGAGKAPDGKSWLERLGCEVSSWVSDVAAHPYAQIGVILICALWFAIGFATDLLTAVLSILAITLTQMVLNHQNEREIDAHRRDVAMHAKLDELIAAKKGARNEFIGVEEKGEKEIAQLKEEVKDAIEEAADGTDPRVRERAEQAVEAAADKLKRQARRKRNTSKPQSRKSRSGG